MTQIIPAIDIIDGKCVRLSKGDYSQKTIYNENPLEVAKSFEGIGLEHLHLVDLDGAKAKKIVNHKVLESICTKTKLKVDFGGGIQTDEQINIAFDCGVNQITAGSIAVKNPNIVQQWLQKYSAEKIILGADTKNGLISISGWEEDSTWNIKDFLTEWSNLGVKYVISTDVAKDGMLQGPSFELYKQLQTDFENLAIIASGGISCIEDVVGIFEMKMYGVIIGKAIYEGRVTLDQLYQLQKNQ